MSSPNGFPRTRTSLIQALGEKPDSSAWREFFHRYAPAVYRVAIFRGLQTTDAEDIVQEVMISIAKQISSFSYDRDRGHFRDWVRRITENKIVSLRRHLRSRETIDRAMAEDTPESQKSIDQIWNEQWQMQDLEYCLDRLAQRVSPTRLAAFRMYAIEGVSASETARRLNIQIGYVYAIRNQILNLIKEDTLKLDQREELSE